LSLARIRKKKIKRIELEHSIFCSIIALTPL